jgi:hypothetical protein
MLVLMARQESDREDLLREASALVERIELLPKGSASADRVVAGFREERALSLFFGADPVYQFNTAGQLRRAYVGGLLFKAAGGRLASLRRERRPNEVQLVRHDLSEDEQAVFVAEMHYRLRELVSQLSGDRFVVVGQVPPEADVLGRVRAWLATHEWIPIAESPHVRGLDL